MDNNDSIMRSMLARGLSPRTIARLSIWDVRDVHNAAGCREKHNCRGIGCQVGYWRNNK